jgi:hypothetical protein
VSSATAALTAAPDTTGAAGTDVAAVAGALGAVGAGAALAGASPRSHGIGSPAFNAATSSSVSAGKPFRFRKACSAAMTELFNGLRGNGGRLPSTPFTVVESAILNYPSLPQNRFPGFSVRRHESGISERTSLNHGSFHHQIRQGRNERR